METVIHWCNALLLILMKCVHLSLLNRESIVNDGNIILATGSEVRGFKPGRGRWIFSERKNPEYDFLRKGSKTVGPVS